MQLSKRQFCDAVKNFEHMLKELQCMEDALGGELSIPTKWIDDYYDFLTETCELEEEDAHYGTDLDWFCYETDFGRKKDYCKIYDQDSGLTWTIESPEILYDYLTRDE